MVEWEYDFPESLPWTELPEKPVRDDFRDRLGLDWSFWGRPYEKFWELGDGLSIRCLKQALADPLQPMSMEVSHSETNYVPFLARRRLQPHCRFACRMRFVPEGKESAGIAVVQAMNHQMHFQLTQEDGQTKLQLLLFTADYALPPYIPGFTSVTNRQLLASVPWNSEEIVLEMELNENDYRFRYGSDEQHLTELAHADGAVINPEKVGCMVGEMLGMFASGNGTESHNEALFAWAEYQDL